jgi:condensin complex subunit 2
MEEISTSFCFICLLHLANEQGLKLESSADRQEADESDLSPGEKKIGNIWDVKVRVGYHVHDVLSIYSPQVYRDPNASQAA